MCPVMFIGFVGGDRSSESRETTTMCVIFQKDLDDKSCGLSISHVDIVAMEEKRANFVRLAESRVNRAIKELRLVGNLSNRSAYSFNDADVRKIFRTLQRELDQAKSRFTDSEGIHSGEFKL
jgi:hypothetical protein